MVRFATVPRRVKVDSYLYSRENRTETRQPLLLELSYNNSKETMPRFYNIAVCVNVNVNTNINSVPIDAGLRRQPSSHLTDTFSLFSPVENAVCDLLWRGRGYNNDQRMLSVVSWNADRHLGRCGELFLFSRWFTPYLMME
jgi:hypothetical protein